MQAGVAVSDETIREEPCDDADCMAWLKVDFVDALISSGTGMRDSEATAWGEGGRDLIVVLLP